MFPKVWKHEYREALERMVDEGLDAQKIVNWTYKLSEEKGFKPGNGSPISVSHPVIQAFVQFRKPYSLSLRLKRVEEEKARKEADEREEAEKKERESKLNRDQIAKKEEALRLLDLVIEKSLRQLEAGERVTLNQALQAINIRHQLEEGRKVEVVLSIEVKTVVQQLITIINQSIPPELRLNIAEKIRKMPALRQIEAAPEEQESNS
jgi:hypothetical protein